MKIFFVLLIVGCVFSSANGMIEMNYWSLLNVVETVTDAGGGEYLYEYSFSNLDTSAICGFGVFTGFLTEAKNTFVEYPLWRFGEELIENAASEYDARNLDNNIFMLTGTSCFFASNHEIQVGESAAGFSFVASVYNPSQKYYFYETNESDFAVTNGAGKVAAVGLTIPEPATICLLALGGIFLRKIKR